MKSETTSTPVPLRAPFPWFGGKSRVASLVWSRLGNVPNYVEPFFGSGAMLLNRPHEPKTETVNDLDGMVCNFWRALAADPDGVAKWADWPVNELDLHARHLWLVSEGRKQVERLRAEPDWFDAKIAGWWVWGLCQWIGGGWCSGKSSWGGDFADGALAQPRLPHLGTAGMGVHRPSQQRPHLGDAGRGVHRPSQQLPHLGTAGMGVHRGSESDLYGYFRLLAERLRRVRVCCGDWERVCGPTPTVKQGLTGVFLDPPYDQNERDPNLYAVETPVAGDVRKWCAANGHDKRMRIALCGYAGEGHESLEGLGWSVVEWKTQGGYAAQKANATGENAKRERIWFSPHCLGARQLGLFDDVAEAEYV